ncbi:MAG: 50S ribosomal protein L3 [Candidatus Vogelbacteria bacterium]|nr:50S ribosomal protein L3 [Candidatus Vogelbacteria bacterium]
MKYILGVKEGMTQVWNDKGQAIAGTIISAGPLVITQLKSSEKDSYEAVQVGSGTRREKNVSKAVKGHTKNAGLPEGKAFQFIREFRLPGGDLAVGDKLDVTAFTEGDKVWVTGVSKAKGFQGVVKRHGFHGGRRSHGQKHSEREPGSIGATAPQRVFKLTRMGGRMGGDRVTVKNLKIVKIDAENNKLFISGAIPGRRGTLLEIIGK